MSKQWALETSNLSLDSPASLAWNPGQCDVSFEMFLGQWPQRADRLSCLIRNMFIPKMQHRHDLSVPWTGHLLIPPHISDPSCSTRNRTNMMAVWNSDVQVWEILFLCIELEPVTVTVLSKLLGSWVHIPLDALMFLCAYIVCVCPLCI
jgi:hypothetical protein